MALNNIAMADFIHNSMGFPGTTSDELKFWSKGIIEEIQLSATVNNASGTITGIAPSSGGLLIDGAGNNGIISGMIGSSMTNRIVSNSGGKYPSATTELTNFCSAIVQHIQNNGIVIFNNGIIIGTCTNTPTLPGTFTGSGSNGLITNLDGNILANLVTSTVPFPSTTTELINMCTAIVNYVMTNAQVSYSLATGIAPAGGGPITAGQASNGVIL